MFPGKLNMRKEAMARGIIGQGYLVRERISRHRVKLNCLSIYSTVSCMCSLCPKDVSHKLAKYRVLATSLICGDVSMLFFLAASFEHLIEANTVDSSA